MKQAWGRLIPAVGIPIIVVGAAIAVPVAAGAAPSLPAKTAQDVLELISTSSDVAYSGTVEQDSDLGLPELPATGQDEASTALEFLTGSHSVRVFTDGAGGQRLQVLDQLAERDVIRNGDEIWLYRSRDKEATRLTFSGSMTPDDARMTQPPTPAELADRLIAGIDPTTSVEVGENARVAGRAVYELTLTPDSDGTLVGSVSLSVDAETGLPLEVEVTARGQDDPAFSVGFSEIDFSAPDGALFDFTPPADAEVTEKTIDAPEPREAQKTPADAAEYPRPTISGEGWETVIDVALPASASVGELPADQSALLDSATTAVEGGRALETALVSVLLTDDGRVLAGAVPVSALQAAAAQ